MHPTRIFKTPSELETAWNEYKEDTKKQSLEWIEVRYVGKDGDEKNIPKKIPYTMEGFERFCRLQYGCVNQYFDNQDGYYDEFLTICSHIRKEIRENQVIGGMLGFFNPSITQRLNSLVDKSSTEIKGTLNIPNLPDIGKR
jgi:hypothetical protein